MDRRRGFALVLVCALLGNTFAVPLTLRKRAVGDNELDSKEIFSNPPAQTDANVSDSKNFPVTQSPFDDDDDDDDDNFQPQNTGSSGGSNVFSLLKLAGALFPGSSGATVILRNLIREYLKKYQVTPNIEPNKLVIRRNGDYNNTIDPDYPDFKPPTPLSPKQNDKKPVTSQKQEIEEDEHNSDSESEESDSEDEEEENNNNGAEESLEENGENGSNENDSDYDDEPPGGGDGQGGGILGILAGLSGGEDGSDLGTLLATVGGIVAQLSGDGIDVNALIASGLGLFVGLLSEGNENPGSVIASYLLTSLETITGGGSKNNGAFFGSFLSKLIKGISAAVDEDASSEEDGGNVMKDSAGFIFSFIMGLLGDMSKGSSSGSSKWDRITTDRIANDSIFLN